MIQLLAFLLLGVVGPIKAGINHTPILIFLLYLVGASFALAFGAWMWSPTIEPLRQGGWKDFPAYWLMRFAHVALIGGLLYATTRALA